KRSLDVGMSRRDEIRVRLVGGDIRNEQFLHPISLLKSVQVREFVHARRASKKEERNHFDAPRPDQTERRIPAQHLQDGDWRRSVHFQICPMQFLCAPTTSFVRMGIY